MSTFPPDLVPQSIEILDRWPARESITRSGRSIRLDSGGHQFAFSLRWPPLSARNYRRLVAVFARSRGIVEPFELVVPGAEPLGTAAGTPIVEGSHVAGDSTLKTRGWLGLSRVFVDGDLFRLGNKVYRVTAAARAGLNGRVTLDIDPGLYETTNDGTPLVVRGLSFRVHLSRDQITTRLIDAACSERNPGGILYSVAAELREDAR